MKRNDVQLLRLPIILVFLFVFITTSAYDGRSRAPRPSETTGVETEFISSDEGTAVCCELPRDIYVVGDLTVGGNIFVNGGFPGDCSNTLIVKQGPITSPTEFNSIKAAVDSITTNSATNPFVVQVCPGLYVEDTITLKPFVAITGTVSGSVIVQPDAPSKNIIIGAPNSAIHSLQLQGATDPGVAAVVFNGGVGGFLVHESIFGSNTILVQQGNTVPPISVINMESISILAGASFTTGVKATATTAAPLITRVFDFAWLRTANPFLSTVFEISGPQARFLGEALDVGSLAVAAGEGLYVQDGARVTLQGATLRGFARAVHIPNVGAGPSIELDGTLGLFNTEDVRIDNPLTTGGINASFSRVKTFIDPGVQMSIFLVDTSSTTPGTVTVGAQYAGDEISDVTNVSPEIQQGSNMGVVFGNGTISVGGVGIVDVGAGTGYLMTGVFPTDDLMYVEWGAQSVAVIPDTDNYIFIDENATAQSSAARPSLTSKILLGKARTDSGNNIVYIQAVDAEAVHTASELDNSWRNALGSIYVGGSIVTADITPPQLDVTNGNYYMGTHQYTPTGGAPISFITFSRGGANFDIFGPQTNVPFDYDSAPDTLTPIPPGSYARHALYVEGDGADQAYILQYGQTLYPSVIAAELGGIPPAPGSWSDNIVIIASIIVSDTAIIEILDERPRLAFKSSGVTTVTCHSDLTCLLNDDHPQYLLVNGMRAMVGDLDMGGNAVFNAATYNGVVVEAHASRHLPISGADPLPTQTPVTIGTVNAIGIQNTFSRGDHVHAHGAQTDPTLHAVATSLAAGFMSAADKAILDAATPLNTPNTLVLRDASGNFAAGEITGEHFIARNRGQMRLQELAINGTDYVALQAPAALLANFIYTWPANYGVSGQVLTTDGTGTMTWSSSGSGDISNGGNSFGADITIGTNDNFGLNLETNGTDRIEISATGAVTINDLAAAGVVQTNASGLLSSTNGANGQLLIGGGLVPAWANITSTGGTVAITNGANSINLESGGSVATSYQTDAGAAAPAAGVLNVFGGNNIGTSGAGNTLTINVAGTSNHAVQIGNASGSLSSLATGSVGQILQSGGAGADPAWTTSTYPSTNAQGDLIYGSAANIFSALAKNTTATRYLANTGVGNGPNWDQVNLANGVTGTLSLNNGGTGATSLTLNRVLLGNGTSPIAVSNAGTNGQVLIGATGAAPAFANLTSTGGTVTFTTGANSLNLETSSATANSFQTNSGTATPVAGVLNVVGGNNISTSGSGNTVTVNVAGTTNRALQVGNATGSLTSLAVATNGQIPIGSTGANPVIALPTNGSNISWVGGAGTLTANLSGTTNHAVQVGNSGGSLTSIATGSAGQILQSGGAGADPAWTTSTYPSTNAQGDLIYGSAANTLTTLAKNTTATRYLANTGTSNNPNWDQVNLTNGVTGTLPVGSGGTGATAFTSNGVLYGNGTSAIQVTAQGAANTVLLGNGGVPSFGQVPNAALVNSSITLNNGNNITVTGSPVSLGGAATIAVSGTTNNAVQVGNASGSLTSLAVGTNGQVLIGATGAAPAFANLTSTGGTVTFTTGANSLNLEVNAAAANAFVQGGNSFGATATLGTNDANALNIRTNSVTRVAITSGGAVSVSAPTTGIGFAVTGNAASTAQTITAGTGQTALAITGSTATAETISAGTNSTALAITGNGTGTAQTITAGTNGIGLTIAGNGTANAMQITAGAGTGGGLLITGGAGSGVPLQVTAAAGTGNAATFTGNATSPTISVTSNAAQNSIITSLGAVGTPSYSFIGDTNTGMYSPAADQLNLTAGGTARLRIDATGSVTSQLNYKVNAYRAATQTINTTTANIVFDTETFDTNNNFDTTTGTYTAPVTGFYMVMTNVMTRTTSQPTDVTVNINRNGAAVTGYSTSQRLNINGVDFSVTTMGLLSMTAGDTLNIAYTTNNSDTIQANGTHVTIWYVAF